MKKLFTLVAFAGLGLGTIGCGGEAPKTPPAKAPETKMDDKKDATPAPGGDAKAPEGAPAPAAPAADEKK